MDAKPVSKKNKSFVGVSRSAAAFKFMSLLQEVGQNALVLCPTDEEAERWHSDLLFFSKFSPEKWQNLNLAFLPLWEQSPYRFLQPSVANRSDRIKTLWKTGDKDSKTILIASVRSALQSTIDPLFFNSAVDIGVGINLDLGAFENKLVELGYVRAEFVEDPGTFSVRGGIVDIFCPIEDQPYRIELFDNSIESIRQFNSETQRSIRSFPKGKNITILPAREFPCDLDSLLKARERIKDWCDHRNIPKSARERYGNLLNQGIAVSEMDYLLPFFSRKNSFLRDHFQPTPSLVVYEPEECRKIFEDLLLQEELNFQKSLERNQPIPEPSLLFDNLDSLLHGVDWKQRVELRGLLGEGESLETKNLFPPGRHVKHEFHTVIETAKKFRDEGGTSIFVTNSQAQMDRIAFLCAQQNERAFVVAQESDINQKQPIIAITKGTLSESFQAKDPKVAFLSEDEIFGQKIHISSQSKKKVKTLPVIVDDLRVGDLIVHAEHGIGRYLGISTMKALDSEADYVNLEYSDSDKLYVPIYRLEVLSKYISGAEGGSLDRLGSSSFSKAKDRVRAAVKDIAVDLLRVQAERTSKEGFKFSEPDKDFREWEAEFPFDETPDQEKAINEALEDMCTGKPMDRLICGDVGFGKTEVAIRAAYKAVQDGKQVAVLVPTTILSEQHMQTFSNRLSSKAVKIASISRFRSSKEQSEILENLKNGKLDIIIGTHRLLSKDISFHDLGLLVIDEEQRFGVEHKEKLKQLKATTDVLTLTATPIPRTLQMSLMGLKDVSIIRTPPGERLTIKTFVSTFNEDTIQSAIRAELGRGGQVFFIHNRILDINQIEELVRKLVPECHPVVAHGQMNETQLERAMIGFYEKKFDVLIATAIVENGLDIPNANTLIVNRADTFGLSQLYQIRGRVGRSNTRAFAYFFIPESGNITGDAKERLQVLQNFMELGSGYAIATHDLELRGGGDVLGQEQSGHIASVGYEMYVEMLQDEIMRLKGKEVGKKLDDVEINIPFTSLLPEGYIPEMKARLGFYRKISFLSTEEQIIDAEKELADRYGPLPKEASNLMWVVRLKNQLRSMGLKSLSLGSKGISLSPGKDPILEPAMIIGLVQSRPEEYSILPEGKFIIRGNFRSVPELCNVMRNLLLGITQ